MFGFAKKVVIPLEVGSVQSARILSALLQYRGGLSAAPYMCVPNVSTVQQGLCLLVCVMTAVRHSCPQEDTSPLPQLNKGKGYITTATSEGYRAHTGTGTASLARFAAQNRDLLGRLTSQLCICALHTHATD